MPTAAGLYYFGHQTDDPARLPVVMIHGAGGTHLYWPPQVRRLSGYRVYALDLPGHGRSEGIGEQSIQGYVRSVQAFADALGLARAVYIGHSMGSAIALTLALDHPERVLGLGLVGAGARLRVAGDLLADAGSPSTFPAAVQRVVERAFSSQAPPRLKELAAQRMAETRPTVLHGDFLACDCFDVMERLEEVAAPALVVCGRQDQLSPLKYTEYLCAHLPAARLAVVEGAGHMVMLEQPEAVAGLLDEFIGQLEYQPGMR
jgi:pimeloyl-ACP methyl ester carboxylesterase